MNVVGSRSIGLLTKYRWNRIHYHGHQWFSELAVTKRNLFEIGDIIPMVKGETISLGKVKEIKDDSVCINDKWINIDADCLNASDILKYWDHNRLFNVKILPSNMMLIGLKNWNIHPDEIKLIKGFVACQPTKLFEDEETVESTRKFLEDWYQRIENASDKDWFELSSISYKLMKNDDVNGTVELLGIGCAFNTDYARRWIELVLSPMHCWKAYRETKQNPYAMFNVLWKNAIGKSEEILFVRRRRH